MNKIAKISLGSLLLAATGLSGCKDFLDVNNNPNLPTDVSPELVLASGTGNLAYVLGGQFQIAGNFLAQHWTQSLSSNQYKELDRYNILQTTYATPYTTLFAGAQQDFQFVINRTSRGDSSNYAAIAGIEQAFTYQLLSDTYDRVPFTEALQGSNNTQPRFDEGPVIYDGAINLINQSVARIKPGGISPGRQDIVFGGDMEQWRRFANTLKLRMFLRQVYVRPQLAEDSIRAMFARGAQFLGGAEDGQVAIFTSTNKNSNPLFLTERYIDSGIQNNIAASSTVIDYLTDTSDPRIDALFDRPNNSATAAFVGTRQGLAGSPTAPPMPPLITALSRPDAVNITGPTAPVILISGAESLFLQAEAALYGWAGAATPKSLYEQGIAASFDRLGVTLPATFLASADIDLDNATTTEAKLDRIITQKWVSMSGSQGIEAWSELRRTNYPSFIMPSISSVLAPGLIANRFLYPDVESSRNPNTPAVAPVQTPVWWDTKPL